jgi:mannose-6-phosphate isomerase-like protein (cupin superfamily)
MALPNPRLVRVCHSSEDDKAFFAKEDELSLFHPFGPQLTGFTIFDIRQAVPVNNSDAIPSFKDTLPRCPPHGSIFSIADFNPGGKSHMHRTQSIDYAIVISGEITLILDNGEEKIVKAGEFIIQQGTNHQWLNNTDAVTRIAFVMLGAEPILSKDGQPLEPDAFKKPAGLDTDTK